MKIKRIYYSSHFKKKAQKYRHLRKKILRRIAIFKKDPFDKRLGAHKLSGRLKSYWSFSVDYRVRILFEFIDEESVGFIDIGTHGIYR